MHENDYFKYYFINALSFIKLRENNIGSIKRSQLNEISLIGISQVYELFLMYWNSKILIKKTHMIHIYMCVALLWEMTNEGIW